MNNIYNYRYTVSKKNKDNQVQITYKIFHWDNDNIAIKFIGILENKHDGYTCLAIDKDIDNHYVPIWEKHI